MRKKNFKGRCVKKTISKAKGVCRTYDALQLAALDQLEADEKIVEVRCNVVLEGSEWDMYTTDFLCRTIDGDLIAFECVFRKLLTRPQTMALLDGSRIYWLKRGAEWRMIVDAENETDA